MGKHANSKVPLSALVPTDLAEAIEKWLEENPSQTRTDFAVKALTEKLRRYGVELPPEPRIKAASKGRTENRRESRRERVQIIAWVQREMLTELDRWRRTVRPQMTRTTFFVEAVAELLNDQELISDETALMYGAYAEYRYATKKFERLLKAAERLGEPPRPEQCTKEDLVKRIKLLLKQLDALKHSPPTLRLRNRHHS